MKESVFIIRHLYERSVIKTIICPFLREAKWNIVPFHLEGIFSDLPSIMQNVEISKKGEVVVA